MITYDNTVKNKEFLSSESIYNYFAEYNVLSSNNLQTLRQKFINQKNGCITLNDQHKKSYMAYYPLKINGWIMCYNIDTDIAQKPYTFIINAEYLLFTLIVLGLLVLLYTIYKITEKHQKSLLEYAQKDALTGIKNKETLKREITNYLEKIKNNI